MLIAATGLMLMGPQVVEWVAGQVGLGNLLLTLWIWLRWPAVVLLLMLSVEISYYVASSVDQPFRFITPGSLLAVIVWILVSLGLSYYVSNFGRYSATYGSVGAVVVLLLYYFISAAVLLLGAEVNAEIYHGSERVATEVEGRCEVRRGATLAGLYAGTQRRPGEEREPDDEEGGPEQHRQDQQARGSERERTVTATVQGERESAQQPPRSLLEHAAERSTAAWVQHCQVDIDEGYDHQCRAHHSRYPLHPCP